MRTVTLFCNDQHTCALAAPMLLVAQSGHGCLQSNLEFTSAGQSAARVAQELLEQTTHVRHSWTFDYVLKTSASQKDRHLSIVELKRL